MVVSTPSYMPDSWVCGSQRPLLAPTLHSWPLLFWDPLNLRLLPLSGLKLVSSSLRT